MNRVYFSQADKRWANHPYPSNTYPKATIKSGGCGPTSASMIISSLKQTVYPNQMADMFRNNGLRASTGTSHEAFTWIAKKYDLKVKKTIYIAEAIECLKRGGMVVSYCKAGGLFSTGGHIIVLSEIRGNNLVVYDPYLYNGKFNSGKRKCVSVKGIECIVSVENFKKYCDYTLYCYEAPVQKQVSKYSEGQAIEIDIPVALTGSKSSSIMGGNDVQVDDMKGTPNSQFWVHETVINKDSHIYARATISWASGTSYQVQVFNRQFWIDEKNIVKKL